MNHPATQDQSTAARRMLDTLEAATYAGLGKSTLDKFRLTGGGPTYIKVGKRVVYDLSDLDIWLASRRRQSTSQVAA
ncbi:MAG: helix-turn-helix domain-containing protein [Candidatus Kaistia colombiensis]|nr:MAG: helix-turn-helix domain-containing protein [Kaistia sp.]